VHGLQGSVQGKQYLPPLQMMSGPGGRNEGALSSPHLSEGHIPFSRTARRDARHLHTGE
jgi:hypothetical protein